MTSLTKSCVFLLFFWLAGFLAVPAATAHPHLWIDPEATFVFDGGVLRGIRLSWAWDELWSQQVIMDCDKNMDGQFSAEELFVVENDYFRGVEDYNYFMDLKVGDISQAIPKPTNFRAMIDQGAQILTYEFFVPLNVLIQGAEQIKLIFNDPTVYTSFGVDPAMLKLETSREIISDRNVQRYDYYGCVISFKVKNN